MIFFGNIDLSVETTRWNPQRFSQNTTLNINRGMNIITVWSGYQIAAWVYDGMKPVETFERKYNSRREREYIKRHERKWIEEPEQKLLRTKDDAKRMEPGDTLFVSHSKLQEWTQDFLPHIETDFVLINIPFPMRYLDFVHTVAPNITNHPNMIAWFSTNIQKSTGGAHNHPNVHPFPIGLKDKMGHRDFQQPVPAYRRVFLESINKAFTKTRKVHAGHLGSTIPSRNGIPSSDKLPFDQYARELAKSKYVLSPNGVHPDCHRTYEAIGLGVIPITELDPILYRHLEGARVVYQNTNWNVTWLEETLPEPDPETLNRNLVFEEYWMEHVERVVGRQLQWWDKQKSRKSRLVGFAEGNERQIGAQ